jgi:predicted transcriptional regulator
VCRVSLPMRGCGRSCTVRPASPEPPRNSWPVARRRLHNCSQSLATGAAMTMPISVRLDDSVRAELEKTAQEEGKPLAALIRDALTDFAREMRRARIRSASAAVAKHVATDPKARAFLADWGTPTSNV